MFAEIAFKPTPADLANAARAMSPPRWGRYERLRLVLAGISIFLLVFTLVAAYVWRSFGLFILSWREAAGFALGGGAMGWLYGRAKAVPAAEDPKIPQRVVRIGLKGLEITGEGFKNSIDWVAIEAIADSGDTILFETAWNERHFVPRRVFPDAAVADAFVGAARSAWNDARNAAPSVKG